ncbi:MAG: transaldolase family protein [Bacillota bacterium]|nr:transaldolase family protein [Bacillota bacterium]
MTQTYFDWLAESTQTRWWHDSGSPDEILLAKERGALGVTTNPVLTYRTFQNEPDFWRDQVQAISPELVLEDRAEALLRLVATWAANQFSTVFQETGGRQGLALGQLNPGRAGDAAGMLAQARRIHSWGDNIAIKLPATRSGVTVVEQLAAEGIPICATLNVSVAQALAVAAAYERGAARAEAAGIRPALCLVVQQVGRLDDYLRDVASDMQADVSEDDIIHSGLAVAKRTYALFQEKGYRSIIMPAGLRGPYHLTEMAGAAVTFSITTRVQNMVLEADPPQETGIDKPVDPGTIARLMRIPEFVRAYEPDGLVPADFITYGVIQKLLSQFTETGWAPLETYNSQKQSGRWI